MRLAAGAALAAPGRHAGDREHLRRQPAPGPARAQPAAQAGGGAALLDEGAVLIPAFSIGRTQEILYEIEG